MNPYGTPWIEDPVAPYFRWSSFILTFLKLRYLGFIPVVIEISLPLGSISLPPSMPKLDVLQQMTTDVKSCLESLPRNFKTASIIGAA